jgi:hypothetical protein
VLYIDDAQLMAVSTDGRQQGPLTADAGGIRFAVPPTDSPELVIFSLTPLALESERVRQATPPPECRPAGTGPNSGVWAGCGEWQLSPDGQWLAFTWGDWGCAGKGGIAAVNLQTGERRWRGAEEIDWNEVNWFRLLPNDKMVLEYGARCIVGRAVLWDLQTDQERDLGSTIGDIYWNAAGTILAVNEVPFMYEDWSALWVYNSLVDRMFFGQGQGVAHPVWTPDESGLVYEDQPLTYTRYITPASAIAAYPISGTLGPRRILFLDVERGEGRVLAEASKYDYFLCASAADCRWEGDWLQVRRFPFHAREFPVNEYGGLMLGTPDWGCYERGEGCPDSPELLALNWRTGESLPWGELYSDAPPTASLTPGPDLSREELYADPAGRYALYVGAGGAGLWCVPTAGEPAQWIEDGHHFVYIP